jgi:GDPmannose 4,6-dehydratase
MGSMARTAVITGASGQDGSYLTELLLSKGYRVIGVRREVSNSPTAPLEKEVEWETGDIFDRLFVEGIVSRYAPHEVYNLAGVTNVLSPWEHTSLLTEVTGVAPLIWAEEIVRASPHTTFIQAASSEIYDRAGGGVRHEQSLMVPTSPYGMSKLLVLRTIQHMRQSGFLGCNAIFFNHESPRRGAHFLTKKVTKTLAQMRHDPNIVLEVGNLDARRDWGHAKDYVRAMHLMGTANVPDDFVVATGELHSVRDVIVTAAQVIGMNVHWEEDGGVEVGKDDDGRVRIRTQSALVRTDEAIYGDTTKIRAALGWEPQISFRQMLVEMVESELAKTIEV